MSLIKNLGHVGIICDDFMKMRDFYTRVMGLTVTDEDGSAVDWNFEGNGASNLVRNGWKRSMLKVGETATIHANPMKSGEPGGRLQGITLPDGSVVGAKY